MNKACRQEFENRALRFISTHPSVTLETIFDKVGNHSKMTIDDARVVIEDFVTEGELREVDGGYWKIPFHERPTLQELVAPRAPAPPQLKLERLKDLQDALGSVEIKALDEKLFVLNALAERRPEPVRSLLLEIAQDLQKIAV